MGWGLVRVQVRVRVVLDNVVRHQLVESLWVRVRVRVGVRACIIVSVVLNNVVRHQLVESLVG